MKRLGDRLLNWLTLVSLALCAGTVLLWPMSLHGIHQIIWVVLHTKFCLFSYNGGIGCGIVDKDWPYRYLQPDLGWTCFRGIQIPVFLAFLSFAVLPTVGIRQKLIVATVPSSQKRMIIAIDGIGIAVGISALLWLVSLFRQGFDVTGSMALGIAIGIGVPIYVAMYAARDLFSLLLLREPPAPGICLFCGYDLRATPDRCPECGKIPKEKPIWPENEPQIGIDPGKKIRMDFSWWLFPRK